MKTLENNILIYDCDCPMCNVYSGAFIKSGLLEPQGRMPYNEMTTPIKNLLDLDRSRNEIALIDIKQNKVIYGLDSLITILGNNFPFIKIIFRFSPFYWLMKKVYSFISYNRKVIAPTKTFNPEGTCIPDYNVKYRIAFIVMASFFVAWILNLYFANIPSIKNNPHGFFMEWVMTIDQLLLLGWLVAGIKREMVLHYLGHNMVVSVIGALLLLPAVWFSSFLLTISELAYIGYFILPATLMLWQHIRRIKILGLPFVVTLTWVLYRVAIGYIMLNAQF